MLGSAAFVVCSFMSHTKITGLLPAALKAAAPAIGWVFTATALRSAFVNAYIVIQAVLGIAAAAALAKSGPSSPLARRALYYPFIGGIIGGLLGSLLGHFGHRANTVVCIAVLLLQLWATLGGAVMVAAYPAAVVQEMEQQAAREARFRFAARHLTNQCGKTVDRSFTAGLNGLLLDTVLVRNARSPTDKWMLYFGGNAEFLENTLADVSEEADIFGANLILYNARGVGRSNGCVSQISDLVEDAATVAQYVVRKEGINPKHLLLFGHSIGGGLAAQIAFRVFPQSTLILDRTFSSLCDAACCFSPFTPPVTQVIFPLLVGDLDSLQAWNGLKSDRKLILYSRQDEIISFAEASIARLPQFQRGGADARYVVELTGQSTSYHNVPITEFEQRAAIAAFVKRSLNA